jgi:hypothetical protein
MHAASPNRINGWDLFMFDCPYLSKIYHHVNWLFIRHHFNPTCLPLPREFEYQEMLGDAGAKISED